MKKLIPVLSLLFFLLLYIEGTQAQPASGNTASPSYPLNSEQDLTVLLNQIGDAKVVLLGEASHGTSEFYTWRNAIARRLIQEKGFTLITAESEWADSRRLDEFINGKLDDSAAAIETLSQSNRWPYWMWANYETAGIITWLNHYNQRQAKQDKVHFIGLDLYCIAESIIAMEEYARMDPTLLLPVHEVQKCFSPYGKDAMNYGSPVLKNVEDCQPAARNLYQQVVSNDRLRKLPPDERFAAEQYTRVILDGEAYFRIVRKNEAAAWNIRDRHMATTITQLLKAYRPNSKLIVWAHNTHVGDARYTTMPQRGKINLGQLIRQELGEKNVFIVGFGSYKGTVGSGNHWGDGFRKNVLPPAIKGSWEYLLHQQSSQTRIILNKDLIAKGLMSNHIRQRSVGAVYNPRTDAYSGYVYSLIPRRYDAFIYVDETTAIHPLSADTLPKQPD